LDKSKSDCKLQTVEGRLCCKSKKMGFCCRIYILQSVV